MSMTSFLTHMLKKYKTNNVPKALMRGIVEDNDDPANLGRLKVRIPSVHGVPGVTKYSIPTVGLPWSKICSFSAGPGRGSSITPLVGDIVWIAFEDGDVNYPVVLGSCYSLGSEGTSQVSKSTSGMFSNSHGYIENNETTSNLPASRTEGGDATQILYKSVKGSEIGFYEHDGKETMRMIDRLGQIIEFGCQADPQTPIREKGDVTRKNSLPSDGKKGYGYILLQSASEKDEDSKIMITNELVHIENGTSNISLERDHVTIFNGKTIVKLTDASVEITNGAAIIAITNKESKEELSKEGEDSSINEEQVITLTNGKSAIKMDSEDMVITCAGKLNINAGKQICISTGNSNILMALSSIIVESKNIMLTSLGNISIASTKLVSVLSKLITLN